MNVDRDSNRHFGPEASLNGNPVLDDVPDTPDKKLIVKRPVIHDLADLRAKQFAPLKYIVGEFVVEGLTMIGAKSKGGKTSMMLDIAAAVADGGYTLGDIQCVKGPCLYLSLEQGERSIQRHMTKMFGAQRQEWPHVAIAYQWPRSHQGGVAAIEHWIDAHPGARLVVVDTFVRFKKPNTGKDADAYERDYQELVPLQELANRKGIAIVVLHHCRKTAADDPLDMFLGSQGLNAICDTLLVIRRDPSSLYGRGRDIDEVDLALEFNKTTNRWRVLGELEAVKRSDERKDVLELLFDDKQLTVAEIAAKLERKFNTVKSLLIRMKADGELAQPKRGYYSLPAVSALQPESDQTEFWNH